MTSALISVELHYKGTFIFLVGWLIGIDRCLSGIVDKQDLVKTSFVGSL